MNKKRVIIPIFVPHLGCPHNCVFCNQDSITGSIQKVNSEFVKNTVDTYMTTINREETIIEISFFGGTFTAIEIEKQRELLSVAKEYKDNNKIDFIRLSTRPDAIDENILNHLKQFSVDIIELGVQSLDDEVLRLSGRGHSSSDVYESTKLIKSYGFILGHQIMIGLPGSNFERDILTAEKIIDMKPDVCRIYPALVIKNTPMEKMYLSGIYKPYSLNEAINVSTVIYSKLEKSNIKVIRMGLQPTEEINEGSEVVAGPFHPAFRELVESRIINQLILNYVSKDTEFLEININPKDVSKLYANRKMFFNDMKNKVLTKCVKINQDPLVGIGKLMLKTENGIINMSINARNLIL